MKASQESTAPSPPGAPARRADLDQVGMTASLACAVHCAVMPLVITVLPLLGLGFLATEPVEWALIGLSMLLGVSSLCLGFRKHRRGRAIYALAFGFAMLATGRIAEAHSDENAGTALVVLGGVTVAASHFLNRRLCTECAACTSPSGDPAERS